MSISRQNLTVIIVTFKSENVIHECIRSIDKEIKIIVVDNSNNKEFKKDLEMKYKNVECILSEKNLGMGAGNNLGIKNSKSDYVFILNPDVILQKNTIEELINASKEISAFGVIAPFEVDTDNPNFEIEKEVKLNFESPFNVKSVDGFAMLLNVTRLNKFENFYFFDENFFMYLENNDLCKRITELDEKIFVIPKSKIKHLGAKGVSEKYFKEIELSRNWHWSWSKFYYQKKHNGFIIAIIKFFPKFLGSLLKFLIYLVVGKKFKSQIYYNRAMGFFNSIIGKSSWYRPRVD